MLWLHYISKNVFFIICLRNSQHPDPKWWKKQIDRKTEKWHIKKKARTKQVQYHDWLPARSSQRKPGSLHAHGFLIMNKDPLRRLLGFFLQLLLKKHTLWTLFLPWFSPLNVSTFKFSLKKTKKTTNAQKQQSDYVGAYFLDF